MHDHIRALQNDTSGSVAQERVKSLCDLYLLGACNLALRLDDIFSEGVITTDTTICEGLM